MAISTDAAVLFFGTQDEITVASPSAVDGDNNISTTSDINEWTNDDDAPLVTVVFQGTYAAAPDSGTLDLYVTLCEVDGSTGDEPTMDSAFDGIFLGSRTPDPVTSSQNLVFGPISLPAVKSSQVYQFYIKNSQGDATHDISAGWSLFITPYTAGPHA